VTTLASTEFKTLEMESPWLDQLKQRGSPLQSQWLAGSKGTVLMLGKEPRVELMQGRFDGA